MKEERIYLTTNNFFVRTICPICSIDFKPDLLMFSTEEGQPVCESCVTDNEMKVILKRDVFERIAEQYCNGIFGIPKEKQKAELPF